MLIYYHTDNQIVASWHIYRTSGFQLIGLLNLTQPRHMNFSNSSSTKAMVIEDDMYMQAILQEFLGANYEVAIFPNGFDALASMQSGNIPDLIIADLNTPELSGLELIEQIKISDFFNSVPIIILSGEESTAKRIECLNAGADDFIVKPFNPAELEARIKVILRRMGKLTTCL